MIVRISGEDQYRLDDNLHDKLDELAGVAHDAVEAQDGPGFTTAFAAVLDYVRAHGTVIGEDEIETSDVILPPSDITLQEAASEFTGEGLIPD